MQTAGPPELRGLARSSTLNLVGGATTAILTLALMLVFTRGLGKPVAGVLFSTIALFQVVVAVAGLGVETGVVRFITARRTDAAIGVDDRTLWKIALIPVAVAGVVLAAGMWALSAWAGQSIGGTEQAAEAASALRAMAPFLPLAALATALLGATRGYTTMRPTVVIDRIIRPVFQLATVWAAVTAGAAPGIIALLWAAAFALELGAAWWWLLRLQARDPQQGQGRSARQAGRDFWGFTLPRAAATTMRTTLQWFDVVLVAALSSPEEAAVYTVATRFLQLGLLAAFSVGQAAEPLFGEAVAAGDDGKTGRLYQVSTAWLILVTWPFYIILALFAPAVLSVFGPGFASGDEVILVLVVSVLIGAAVGPADILLVMKGKTTWSLWNTAAALTVNLALNAALIPRIGIIGAAVAWTASRIVGNALPVAQLWQSARLHPFGRAWAVAMAATTIPFALIGGVGRAALGTSLAVAVAAGLVACLVFALILRRLQELLSLDLALASLRKANR